MRIIDIWSVVIIGVIMVTVGWVMMSPTVNGVFDVFDDTLKPDLTGLALATYVTVISVGKITFNLSPVVISVALVLWGFAKTQQRERVTEWIR